MRGNFVEKSMIPEGTNMGSKFWLSFSCLVLEIPSTTDDTTFFPGKSKESSTEISDGSTYDIILNFGTNVKA